MTCATCKHSKRHEMPKPKGPVSVKPGDKAAPQYGWTCRRNPPTVFPMMIPPAVQGAPAQITLQAYWAPVGENDACGEYAPAVAGGSS